MKTLLNFLIYNVYFLLTIYNFLKLLIEIIFIYIYYKMKNSDFFLTSTLFKYIKN